MTNTKNVKLYSVNYANVDSISFFAYEQNSFEVWADKFGNDHIFVRVLT